MLQRKRVIIIVTCLLVFTLVALLGGILGRKTGKIVKEEAEEIALRCTYDGTKIKPLYQVDAYLNDGTGVSFCSIYCATQWFRNNKDKVIYFTVVDEVTGQKFDSTLGHFVESEVVTIPEVKNRIHAFYVKEDALTHAQQFNGKLIENPFGRTFVLPEVAKFDKLRVGAPSLPDALPLRLAIFRPIFKENRLDVDIISFRRESEGKKLLSEESVAGIICDLPMGLLLAKASPSARIVKNVLRANPYRPLFALVAGPKVESHDFVQEKGQTIALPRGVSFRFYAEYYLKGLDIPISRVVIKEVEDMAKAWDLVNSGEVSAALLRTPYTDMAMAAGMAFLADDRNLPWMSVLVFRDSVIREKAEGLRRFVFALEQAVLALNLKPDEYRIFLNEQGGIPRDGQRGFPMPIFEGANVPSREEVAPVLSWLREKGMTDSGITYQELVSTRFLPDPQDVGLAFCCR